MENKKYTVATAVSICFKYAPGSAAANIILNILNGLLSPVMVYAVAVFVDSAVTLALKEPQTAALVISVAVMLLGYAYNQLSGVFNRLCAKDLENRLRLGLRPLMIQKQAGLHFELTEDDKTLDLISYVCQGMEQRFTGVISCVTAALRLAVQMAGILSILVSYVWWTLPVFIIGAVPLIIFSFKGGAAVSKSYKKVSALSRMMYYLSDILSGREASAERTLFGYTNEINDRFKALHLKRSNMNTKTIAIEITRSKACGIILNIFVLAVMLAMTMQVSDKTVTLGLYVSITGTMINFVRVLNTSLQRLLYDLSGHIEYFKDFTRFFALPGDDAALEYTPGSSKFEKMTIKNLYFKYKDADKYVLKGVNLQIEKGKSYSLIGKNGAGKTTLTKIITGLYRDFEGEIIINGRDIREFSLNELRDMFSVIYQDYAKYYIRLQDNVTFGADAHDFDRIARLTELDGVIDKLPHGSSTPLGKIFDTGMDISGGEWQKIAIARAVYKNCPFMILDEPTASLSPMMESKIYNKFAEISAGHALLLISHRLGSTKLSDTLLVLDGGIIAEEGSHDELMQKNGLYAEMFESQRSWYDE